MTMLFCTQIVCYHAPLVWIVGNHFTEHISIDDRRPSCDVLLLSNDLASSLELSTEKANSGCYLLQANGAIATKQIANISIDLKASIVTFGFDLGHDLDLEFSRSNMEFAISLPKMVLLA